MTGIEGMEENKAIWQGLESALKLQRASGSDLRRDLTGSVV